MNRSADKCVSRSGSSRNCSTLPWRLAVAICITAIGGQAIAADEPYIPSICKQPYDSVVDWHADHAAATSAMTEEDVEAGKPLCPDGPGPADGYPRPEDPPVVPVAALRASIIRLINSIQSLEDTTPERVDEVMNLPWEWEASDEMSGQFGRLDDDAFSGVSVNRSPQPHNFAILVAINEFDPPAQCSIEADELVDTLVGEGWKVHPKWTKQANGRLGRVFSKDLPTQQLQVIGAAERTLEPRESRYCFSSLIINTRPLDAPL